MSEAKFKVGDWVQQDRVYIRSKQYLPNGKWNYDLKNLGEMRYVVTAVHGDCVDLVIASERGRPLADAYAPTGIPMAQLRPAPRNVELEAAYEATVNKIKPQISELLRLGETLIQQACTLADEHGIPFTGPSALHQSYQPHNLPKLPPEVIAEITGEHIDRDASHGWERSALC